jgi:hypothetical protein
MQLDMPTDERWRESEINLKINAFLLRRARHLTCTWNKGVTDAIRSANGSPIMLLFRRLRAILSQQLPKELLLQQTPPLYANRFIQIQGIGLRISPRNPFDLLNGHPAAQGNNLLEHGKSNERKT